MTAPEVGPDGPLYLTTREVAARFRTSPSSVRDWRSNGKGPLGVKFGREVLYPLPEVEAWEQKHYAEARAEQDRNAGRSPALTSVASLRAQGHAAPRRRTATTQK